MFNDERINAECGKIYSRGILLAVLLTLVYAAVRTAVLVIQDSLVSVLTYNRGCDTDLWHRHPCNRGDQIPQGRR